MAGYNFTETVLEHFKNPRNVGEIADADAVGSVGSAVCGDTINLTLKVEDKDERIVDARFQTFGCAAAIASSSIATEMMKGRTLDEAAQEVTRDAIVSALGGLPEAKVHCSVLAADALQAAVADYRKRHEGK